MSENEPQQLEGLVNALKAKLETNGQASAALTVEFIGGKKVTLFGKEWALTLDEAERLDRLSKINGFVTNDTSASTVGTTFTNWLNSDGTENVPAGEFETPLGRRNKSLYGAAVIDINVYWADKQL